MPVITFLGKTKIINISPNKTKEIITLKKERIKMTPDKTDAKT